MKMTARRKPPVLMFTVLLALALCNAVRGAEVSSGAIAHAGDAFSTNTNEVVMMSVGTTAKTTALPPGKSFEVQVVRPGGSVRIGTQGDTVTKSAGGIEITTGQLYTAEHEVSKKLSAIVTEGSTSTIVIVVKKGP